VLDRKVVGIWDFVNDSKPLIRVFLFEKVEREALRGINLRLRKSEVHRR